MFFLRLGSGLGHLAGANDESPPEVSAQLVAMFWRPAGCRVCVFTQRPILSPAADAASVFWNSELDRLIAELETNPLAEGELREWKEGLYVSLNQSQPESLDYAFCLSWGGRMYFFFRKAADSSI